MENTAWRRPTICHPTGVKEGPRPLRRSGFVPTLFPRVGPPHRMQSGSRCCALRSHRPRCCGPKRATTTGRGRCAGNISHSVLLRISAPDLDSGALSVSELDSPRAPDTWSEWSLDWAPAGAVGRCQLVSCPQRVVVAAAQLVAGHRWHFAAVAGLRARAHLRAVGRRVCERGLARLKASISSRRSKGATPEAEVLSWRPGCVEWPVRSLAWFTRGERP